MIFKPDNIRVFCAVAEYKNIVRAAEKLGKTASAISMSLKMLEDDVGGSLFIGDRKSKLTALGQYVYERGLEQLNSIEQFEVDIEHYARSEEGVINILSVPSITNLLLIKCLKRCLKNYPKLHFVIGAMSSGDIIRQVKRKEADLGIISVPKNLSFENLTGLEYQVLFEDRLGLVFHKNHPLNRLKSIKWEVCTQFEIVYNPLCSYIDYPPVMKSIVQSPIKANNNHSILAILSEEIGYSILPESLEPILPPDLRFVLPSDTYFYRKALLIYNSLSSLPPAVSKMHALLCAEAQVISKKLK